jgi:hypothetical protein
MSNNDLLVTFGCSWTFGVGVGWTSGITKDQFKKIAWDVHICEKYSWRGILSDRYNLVNKNFACGGSSNQMQERLAMQYFTSEQFQKDRTNFNQIIVLWGITSTARTEMFDTQKNKLENFSLTHGTELSKSLLKYSYNHDYEVWLLSQKMRFWNLLFKNLNIKNFWFDTFNHHDYSISQPGLENLEKTYQEVAGPDWPSWEMWCKGTVDIPKKIYQEITNIKRWNFWKYCPQPTHDLNLMFVDKNPRDLLSLLSLKNGCQVVDNNYHYSNWDIDTNRIDYLVKQEILNPISFHPTDQGHVQISEILSDPMESLLI